MLQAGPTHHNYYITFCVDRKNLLLLFFIHMVQIKHFITVILGVAAIAPVVARPLIDNGKLEDANGRVGAEITRGRKQSVFYYVQ